MAKHIRYAVVGAGWISQIAFLPGAALTGNSTTTAIVSGNPEGAAKLAEFYGIEHVYSYDEYDKMLASDVADAVYIALPNSMHADYTIRAAKAGKHILCEKPLAPTVEECEAMIAAARDAGVMLMTAYRIHNQPFNVHVLDLVRQGAIGDPRLFSSVFTLQAEPDNHRLRAEHWGGPLQDIGIYCLNAVRHLFASEPALVAAIRNSVDDPRFKEVEETLAATLLFPEGRMAQFTASFGAEPIDTYRITGTAGEIVVEGAYDFRFPARVRVTSGGETTEKEFPLADHFAGLTAYFSDCIATNTPPEADGGEGLADVRIMRAIEKAAETGKTQRLKMEPRPGPPDASTVRQIEPATKMLLL